MEYEKIIQLRSGDVIYRVYSHGFGHSGYEELFITSVADIGIFDQPLTSYEIECMNIDGELLKFNYKDLDRYRLCTKHQVDWYDRVHKISNRTSNLFHNYKSQSRINKCSQEEVSQ